MIQKPIRPLSFLVVLGLHLTSAPAETKDISIRPVTAATSTATMLVDTFPGPSDRERINQALVAAKANANGAAVVFSKREYRITAVDFDTYEPILGTPGLTNVTLQGNGATLVATDMLEVKKGYLFKLSQFSNVTMSDLTLTFRPLPFVQGKVLALLPESKRVRVELDPRFGSLKSLRKNAHDFMFSRVALATNTLLPKPDSPSWLAVGCGSNGYILADAVGPDTWELDAGNWFNRAKVLGGVWTWAVGDPMVLWKRGAQDGFTFDDGEGLHLERIKVEACLHFSLKLRGVRGASLAHCAVEPVAGGMLSGCADGIDVQQSTDIRIEHGRITANGDDGISFLNHGHGHNGLAFEKPFPKPWPNKNVGVVLASNTLLGCNRNGILLLATKALVVSNDVRHIRQYGLKLSGDGETSILGNRFARCGSFSAWAHIMDEVDTGILCMAPWRQKQVTIEGNLFEDWYHMPAILGTALENAVIAGNTFRLGPDFPLSAKPHNPWMERNAAVALTPSLFMQKTNLCRAVIIQSNVFDIAGLATADGAVVLNGTHSNIRIEGNRIGSGTRTSP